jgi:hypothetical protein
MVYRWVTARTFGQYPPTGSAPLWNTPSGIPKVACRVPSPVGAGDVLIRTRVSGFIGIYGVNANYYPLAAASQLWQLLGEVGSSSSLPPDPGLTGTNDFAFSYDMQPLLTLSDTGSPTSAAPWTFRANTDGEIESKARRGPAEYGSVHPSFNLGLLQNNDAYLTPGTFSINSWWGFTVRCLWLVP